jgi:hypothetical protein
MQNNYQALLDILKPKEEDQLMSMEGSQAPMSIDATVPPQSELVEPIVPENAPQEQMSKITNVPTQTQPAQPPMNGQADTGNVDLDKKLSPLERYQALMDQYRGEDQARLEEARSRDRMLKVGGSIGDALATYLNAQGQKNVKAPGVQVQQGAGLGKVADMFATAPEIQSDIAQRRQDLLAQYKLLAMGKDGEKVYQTKSGLIKLDKEGKPIELYSDPSVKRSLDISEKRLKQAEGRMDLSTTAEERRKEELQFKKGEANELKPKEMETLTGFDSSLDSLDRLEGLNKDFWTGPVEGRISQLSRILGTDSGAKTKLAAQMEMVLSRYAKQISGTAVGEQEFERLRNQLPNETDSDAAFSAKFSNFRDELELSRNRFIENYGKIRDVEPFKERKSLVKKDENKKQGMFPKTVTNKKTKETATVENDQELKEALAEGFE